MCDQPYDDITEMELLDLYAVKLGKEKSRALPSAYYFDPADVPIDQTKKAKHDPIGV